MTYEKQINDLNTTRSIDSDSATFPHTEKTTSNKGSFFNRVVNFPNTSELKVLISKVTNAIKEKMTRYKSEKPPRPLATDKSNDTHSASIRANKESDSVSDFGAKKLETKNKRLQNQSKPLSERSEPQFDAEEVMGVASQEGPAVAKEEENKLSRHFNALVLQRGERIVAKFKDAEGKVFCEESAQRTRTVELVEKSLNKQLKALNDLEFENSDAKDLPQNKARRQHLESNLRALNQIKDERAKKGKACPTWASTDAPRAHFRRCLTRFLRGTKWDIGKTEKKMRRGMALCEAKKDSLAITGNMRYQQTFLVGDEKLYGYGDPRLEGMIKGEDPSKGVITDPKIIARFNLYHALVEAANGKENLSIIEKDLGFKTEIAQLKKEMGRSKRQNLSASPVMNLIGYLQRSPIPYLIPDGKGVVRSASITDFMHGETNVEDIRILSTLLKMRGSITEEKYTKLNAEDKSLLHKYYLGSLFKGEKMEFQPEAAEKLKQKLYKDVYTAYPEKSLESLAADALVEALDQMALERDAHLMEKVLQDLSTHLSNNPVMAGESSIFFGRVGLVDTNKPPNLDPNGFCLNERSMAMDSCSAYRMLQGKTIVFDGEEDSPLMQDFENSERIHAPKNWSKKGPNSPSHEVTVSASYINISIAGHLENEGVQQNINREDVDALRKILQASDLRNDRYAQDLMNHIEKGTLEGSKGGDFSVVADALELMNKLGYVSVNCYGGKDRTGYVCAVHDKRKMENYLQSKHPDNAHYQKGSSYFSGLGLSLFAYNGIAVGVIRDNVAISAVKLARADLDLLLEGEGLDFLKGAARLAVNGVQFAEGFLPRILTATVQKMLKIQPGEGDLYSFD